MVKRMAPSFKFLSTYAAIFLTISSQVEGNRDNLISYLFNESRYDKRIMPSTGYIGPLNVTLGLTILKIHDLEELNQRLVTHTVLYQSWNDPHLIWNPSAFNGTKEITVNPRRIWFPDIVLYNSGALGFAKGLMRNHGLLNYKGRLQFNYMSIFRTLCHVDVASYPIDRAECKLKFGSWGYHGRQIVVQNLSEHIDLSMYVVNGEWTLERSSVKQNLIVYGGSEHPYYDVTFSVTIRRQVIYHTMYLIIPGTLVALVASIMFWLPQECSERVTLGMTVLVALSFFFIIVSENMPASSKVPLIGGYYAITMVEMSISFFLNVFVLRFHHMTDDEVPAWVKKYILHYAAWFLRMNFHGELKLSKETKIQQNTVDVKDQCQIKRKLSADKKEISAELFVADKVITAIVQKRKKIASRDAEWKKAAEVLNNYALILHLLAVITTFAVVFWEKFLHNYEYQHKH